MAWAAFQANAWRIKTAGLGGVVGFELDSALQRLIAAGTDPEIAEDLLASCTAGALKAYHEKKDEDDGGEN